MHQWTFGTSGTFSISIEIRTFVDVKFSTLKEINMTNDGWIYSLNIIMDIVTFDPSGQ